MKRSKYSEEDRVRVEAGRERHDGRRGVPQDGYQRADVLRIPTVVDTFSRFSPAVVPRFSFRPPDVIEVLERVYGEVG